MKMRVKDAKMKRGVLGIKKLISPFRFFVQVIDLSVCQTRVEWNTNLHMALYEQIKDVEVFIESLKGLWVIFRLFI